MRPDVFSVFLDIVGYTKNRSVEAQSDLVGTLNHVVTRAMDALTVAEPNVVLLPTGDGIAIAMIDIAGVDVHLRLALEILRLVAERNAAETDAMRRFEVRIGINENIDNLVTDINGRRNVAGAGISTAQRIMDKADGGQVLVGQTVYEVLRQRESYLSSFRKFRTSGKHEFEFDVYQFVAKEAHGLNVAVPSAFARPGFERPKLTKFTAYYMCHAIKARDFLEAHKGDAVRDYVAVILLGFLATDSLEAATTPSHEEPMTKTWRAGSASFEEQYHHYKELEFWPLAEFSTLFEEKHLARYRQCFEGDVLPNYAFVSAAGIEKLQTDWPDVAGEFDIPILVTEQDADKERQPTDAR